MSCARGLAVVCAILGACWAQAAAPEHTRLDAGQVEVPFDRRAGFVAVRVMVNGEGPYWFNIDTYASIHACVDHSLAKELSLPKTGTTLNSDGSGNTATRDIVRLDEIRLGGAVFEGARALVDDYSWVRAPDGSAVRGLLGFELFKKVLLTIDYPESRVALEDGRLARNAEGVIRYSDPSGAPDIVIEIGTTRLTAGIDTGARSGLFMGRPEVEQLEIVGTPAITGRAQSVYGSQDVYAARVAGELKLAGYLHHPVDVTYTDGERHAVIGRDLLNVYVITFDQRRRLVRFSKKSDPR